MTEEPTVSEVYPELHHYTDRAGVEGIWKSGVLFATRFDCLNDRSEVHHFRRDFQKALTKKIRLDLIDKARDSLKKRQKLNDAAGAPALAHKLGKAITDALYSTTFEKADRFGEPYAVPYITSFCAHSDARGYERANGLLSQWRGYGRGERYALVFDTKALERLLDREGRQFQHPFGHFMDVIYNDENLDFESRFNELLSQAFFCFVEKSRSREEFFTPFLAATTRFKHRGFSEEGEVRIVICPRSRQLAESLYRSEGLPTPADMRFKEISTGRREDGTEVARIHVFDWRNGSRLPIKRIIVGPHRRQVECQEEISRLVLGQVKVVSSETPYVG